MSHVSLRPKESIIGYSNFFNNYKLQISYRDHWAHKEDNFNNKLNGI